MTKTPAKTKAKPKVIEETRSETISLRVEPEVKAALERAAAADDRTVSYIAKKAITQWLRDHKWLR